MKMPIILRAAEWMRIMIMKRIVGVLSLAVALAALASSADAQYGPQTGRASWQGPYEIGRAHV